MRLGDRWYLTDINFEKVFSELEKMGFERPSVQEVRINIQRKNSIPYLKKKYEGAERIYEHKHPSKPRKVFVDTTHVDAINDINEHDLIWIGYEDERTTILFFWFPIVRTLNFVDNTIDHARMMLDFMYAIPVCPECGDDLAPVFVDSKIENLMKFICINSKFIHSKEFLKKQYFIFDVILPERSSQLLFEGFRKNLEYQHKKTFMENPPGSARFQRAERKKAAQQKFYQQFNTYGDIRKTDDRFYHDGQHNDGAYGD